MTSSEHTHVEVAVALVTDANKHVLLTFNDQWGSFTLPMTTRRRGAQSSEPTPRAALRAAAETLGVPVRLAATANRRLAVLLESGRQLADKIYDYRVFPIEPHPDLADRLQIRRPHLWLSPHAILSGDYQPISESARFILRSVLAEFEIPARIQHTSVLILQRDDPPRGRQFLVRWNPNWGYALPAKRWNPPKSVKPDDLAACALAGAERVARDELGLEPGADVSITCAQSPAYTTHGVSQTKKTPAFGEATDYVHRLFDGRLNHPEKLKSERPLAWVTEDEIHYGWTAASQPEPGAPQGRSDRVSRTTHDILRSLGSISETADPVLERMAQEWLEQHGGGLG